MSDEGTDPFMPDPAKDISSSNPAPMPASRVFRTWWPLAASWMLMGAELPVLSAIIARLANPEINLAAYGGIVFPLALIIESPIIMLLAASTALSRDWSSYIKLRQFMMVTSATLTALHILVAFTPLYYLVVEGILRAPAEIVEPARVGLMIMTPWTWAIAYRRFNQGVLIRFGYSKSISVGTMIRLFADATVLLIGYSIGSIPGIIVATTAVAAGVIFEAAYVGLVVQPVLRNHVRLAPSAAQTLTLRSFLDFYIPLAMTSLLTLIVQPMGSAALGRMPQPLESLAVWPVVTGLIFMLRGLGMAFNEVVVALLDEPLSLNILHRFTVWLAVGTTAGLLILAATPLSSIWFEGVSALNPSLANLARTGLWVGLFMPALTVYQSWYQGAILNGQRTRGITEAVIIFLVTSAVILTGGVIWGQVTGLYIGLAAFLISSTVQNFWLWHRSRPILELVKKRDQAFVSLKTAESTTD
jgi:hypothetical protein